VGLREQLWLRFLAGGGAIPLQFPVNFTGGFAGGLAGASACVQFLRL